MTQQTSGARKFYQSAHAQRTPLIISTRIDDYRTVDYHQQHRMAHPRPYPAAPHHSKYTIVQSESTLSDVQNKPSIESAGPSKIFRFRYLPYTNKHSRIIDNSGGWLPPDGPEVTTAEEHPIHPEAATHQISSSIQRLQQRTRPDRRPIQDTVGSQLPEYMPSG